ncbi:hypothetical protein ASPACDRAFT_1854328 [Aspergillus aculeatus ATCC 16872]|uniref:Uncharacterized protein n=1 Tax=Aspergillus aculeatus (strain ATCC 16872 / CBS 172.66 / WB 5094) TaxID=690307 RepID=A0A1L9X2F8_ASPA1|nr:uncharacterized protein ASPACDRAFT_1854328 [Aspergillus aculeatus ATCC 16872]OJK02348.1 hypothetical protein ASPACDRAFT_1854328 [Aspergillus aculeatus ATCC 16872]
MQLVYLVVMLGALVAAGSTDPHDQQADHSLVPHSGHLLETMDSPCTEEPNIPGPRVQTGKRSLLGVNRKRDSELLSDLVGGSFAPAFRSSAFLSALLIRVDSIIG